MEEIQPSLENIDERASAFQQTIVFMRQKYPNMAVMTYDNVQHQGAHQVLLAKFVLGLGETYANINACKEGTANNIAGGLTGECLLNGKKIDVSIYPLMVGRDTLLWEGASLIKISHKSDEELLIKFGCGNMAFMHFSPNQMMSGEKIDCENGTAYLENNMAFIARDERPIITAVKGNFEFTVEKLEETDEKHGHYIVGKTKSKDAYLLVGFSENKNRAIELANLNPNEELEKIQNYYSKKLENWYIKTPDKDLDEAFMHAFLNIEYSWVKPYGWIESFHHWPTMWHMEQTVAEEWAGNFDRVKDCLHSLMKNIFPSGAIPDMCMTGKGRRDWGGNNQFFFREVDHYLKMTKDIDFAIEVEPFMHKVLKQCFDEYDPSFSGILSWATQIGNQEDFEATPGKGAATGSEGVRMLEIMADFKEMLGKIDESKKIRMFSKMALQNLKKLLWLKDLGRFAWYEDPKGQIRLDTTYHGICYPVIYNQISDLDNITSLDHLKHRLSGVEGEVYQSNHFGDHCYFGVPTWGMQCGSDMQAFATMAYAKAGMNNDAVRPLSFIAKRVCGDYQRGSFPETANETRFAYFSPSAGVYAQGIIESIFGVKVNLFKNQTIIEPCFPSDWKKAAMQVTGAYINFDNNKFKIKISNDTQKILKQKLPPFKNLTVLVDGKKAETKVTVCGDKFQFEAALGTGQSFNVEVSYTLLDFEVNYKKVATTFDTISVNAKGVKIVGIDDSCLVLKNFKIDDGKIEARINQNLLEPYEKFGWQGMINFARRTFFIKLQYENLDFYYPCTLTVIPPFVIDAKLDGDTLSLNIDNDLMLSFFGEEIFGSKNFKLTNNQLNNLSPGQNKAKAYFIDLDYYVDFVFEADVKAKVVTIDLEDKILTRNFKDFKPTISYGHMILQPDLIMKDLFETNTKIDILNNVEFKLNASGFVPINIKNPLYLPLDIKAKKLYLLVSAFCDNHDVFSTLATIYVTTKKGTSYIKGTFAKEITFPGEVDMGYPNHLCSGFATYVNGTDKSFIPTLPNDKYSDYPDAVPYHYPQRSLWTKNRAVEVSNTIFNVIEIDLEHFVDLESLCIIPKTEECAVALFALSALKE